MKRALSFVIPSILIVDGTASFYGQQRDIKAILKRDIVKTVNGMYSIHEYGTAAAFDKDFNIKEFQGGKSSMHLNWLTQLYQEIER